MKIKTWKMKMMALKDMNPSPYNPKIHTEDFLDRWELFTGKKAEQID